MRPTVSVEQKIRQLLSGVHNRNREFLKDFLMKYPEFREEEYRSFLARRVNGPR